MPEVSTHSPGMFCWPELATTDQAGAAAFYRALFGWEVDDRPMGPGETYSMFKLHGREAAAGYGLRPEQRQQGVPPHWGSYVSVASADDSASRAASLGGRVIAGPFDVFDAGRMAVVQDPSGAFISLWEPKKHIGARVLNEPGALGWAELNTRDLKAAERFYTALFGWGAKTSTAVDNYTEFTLDGRSIAGMMAIQPSWGNVPPNWVPYFVVKDCDQAVDRAQANRGSIIVPAKDIPRVGRFAFVRDPQGAVFAVIALA